MASEVVRYGIIGAGMMGREHMMNLSHLHPQGAVLTCVADPHPNSQQQALHLSRSLSNSIPSWPPLKVFSGHGELLDSGLCDVVVVSSPNMTHFEILMDIIAHSRPHHILVEKPLCTTVQHCKKAIDAAKRRPEILVQVGLEYRYMPPVAKLIEIVQSGKLGKVKMVAIREHRFPFLVKDCGWTKVQSAESTTPCAAHYRFDKLKTVKISHVRGHFGRKRIPKRHVSSEGPNGVTNPTELKTILEIKSMPFVNQVNNWNRFNINSGGTLVEKCCHFFDLMRLFASANPVRVMASGAIDVNHKDEIYDGKVPDIIDNAYVIVEFDNGSRGMLDLCMFAEGSKNEQEISVVGDIGKGEAFVPESVVRIGTRAGGRDGVETLKAEDERIKYDGLHHGSSYLEHLNFLSAVKAQGSGGVPVVDLNDGLLSVAIGVAGQLSIEKGRFATLEEVLSEQ